MTEHKSTMTQHKGKRRIPLLVSGLGSEKRWFTLSYVENERNDRLRALPVTGDMLVEPEQELRVPRGGWWQVVLVFVRSAGQRQSSANWTWRM